MRKVEIWRKTLWTGNSEFCVLVLNTSDHCFIPKNCIVYGCAIFLRMLEIIKQQKS